ncbi:MAG TPA: hypothetical protein DCX17_04385 [Firmicutes bacterium]|nr:hypothetical protein [Bacillota bacterium]
MVGTSSWYHKKTFSLIVSAFFLALFGSWKFPQINDYLEIIRIFLDEASLNIVGVNRKIVTPNHDKSDYGSFG